MSHIAVRRIMFVELEILSMDKDWHVRYKPTPMGKNQLTCSPLRTRGWPIIVVVVIVHNPN
jgi:hypothetical protein